MIGSPNTTSPGKPNGNRRRSRPTSGSLLDMARRAPRARAWKVYKAGGQMVDKVVQPASARHARKDGRWVPASEREKGVRRGRSSPVPRKRARQAPSDASLLPGWERV